MNKPTPFISMALLLSLSIGNSAWSQGPGRGGPAGGWGGPGGHSFGGQDPGVPRIGQPVFNTGCGQQYTVPAQQPLRDACIAGGAAAMQVAQRFASQQGRNDGFRTGYAWGIRNGIDSTRSDNNQISAGTQALNANDSPAMIQKLAIADQAGISSGQSQGSADGDQEAVSRFHQAIDTGSMPSQSIASSDYARYSPQYSSPYANPYAQTIAPIQSELDVLNSGQIDPGQVQFYGSGYDNGIFGNAPQFRPGDFYSPDGRYGFNRGQSMDGRNAFNMYVSRGFNHGDYDRLGPVQIITGYTQAPATPNPAPAPAPGNPPVDNGGGNGGGHGAPGAPGAGGPGSGGHAGPTAPAAPTSPAAPTTPTAPAAPAPFVPQPIYTTYDLKQIYQDAFIRSYQQVAGFYYNDAFNNILNDGTNAGFYAGQQVGERLAFQTGIVNAYNNSFRQREGNAFYLGANGVPGFNGTFNASFASEYQNYATHPMIGVDSFSIVGIRNDGIVEPGEQITASFVVRNYGGVDATLPVVMEGDVTGAQQASLLVPKLSTSRQGGSLSASIAPNVASQSNANVVLDVNGNRIPLVQYVTNQVVTSGGSYNPDAPHGNVSVNLPLKNVSTANSYDAITVIVTDSMGRSQTLPVGFLAGGQSWNAPINLTGYNPLDMIDGKVSVSIQALLGSVVVGASNMTISAGITNTVLAQTFEAQAQGSNSALQGQISDRIFSVLKQEATTQGRGHYNNDTSTLIYAIVQLKKSHSQNATSLAAYKALANKLAPIPAAMHAVQAGLFGSKSENQKYFESQLQVLNSN